MAGRRRLQPAAPPPEIRDGFKFRSGNLALDLAATLAARLKAEPRELLETRRDLGRWLVAAGLAESDPGASEGELAAARELREALYRLALARVGRRPYGAADLELVNRWAAEPPPAPQLSAAGLYWDRSGVRPLLAAVARQGVELLGGERGERIRQCSGAGCALLFVDASRAGRRRWCSMAGCGNKAKVTSFRQRRKVDGD